MSRPRIDDQRANINEQRRNVVDLIELRKIDKVVDRLAAQGPSGVSAVHCWFCGKVEAWFRCDCRGAQDARDGKRPKPRWDDKRGCIVLDEAVIATNEALGYKRRPRPAPKVHGVDTVDTPAAIPEQIVDSVDSAVDRSATRRAYKAEHERQRRARAKEGT